MPDVLRDMDVRIIRGVGTATLVAATWTNSGELTWSETFEANKDYEIVGAMFQGATVYAGRLVYKGDEARRPGAIGSDTVAVAKWAWGRFGAFPGTQPPTADFVASAGDTAQVVCLAVIPKPAEA